MKTARGIYNNLEESEYYLDIEDLEFRFSSKFYLEKFILEYENFINYETSKIIATYKLPIHLKKYLLIAFYKKIEKRGFLIYYKADDKIRKLEENEIFYSNLK